MWNASDISVVIPTFDRAELVCRALRSVQAQTAAPGEVVLVDDGSSDGTAARVGAEFPRVNVLVQPNRGVSAARNRGVAATSGEWIALLDSDDEWRPTKLERQLEALRRAPGYRLCHTDEIWIRRGNRVEPRRRHRKLGGWIFDRCLSLCLISPSSVLIHRSLFDEVGGFDERLPVCEDYELWLRICAREPVLLVPEALVIKYGGHDDQLSRSRWGMDRFRIQALEKLFSAGLLGERDLALTRQMLVAKIGIYLTGARKRERVDEVRRYERKLELLMAQASESGTASYDDRRGGEGG